MSDDAVKTDTKSESGDKLERSEEEWQRRLTPEQYYVLRCHGTEPAFTGKYHAAKTPGTYNCGACGQALFGSDTKFDSGTGWPSFWAPVEDGRVATETDRSMFMVRNEVKCGRCQSHLGHVFEDGPAPTGLRYCINSLALELDEDKQ